ncbi:MAG: MucR family transcriptional regulator [Sphingobium sp.]|uniref:MucR family transcriptional regulator n=1 Tax=Sphingobium sp. TaxID=1912891 RepID=UPI0029A482CB|nr:MucR family transcriptional regulator [Sphingobium sp.]MDX3911600.1 MucR family transcriptional regulator [Sphingobium sp.]
MPEVEAKQAGVAALTVELLSAYLANNSVPSEELANLILSTRSALTEELAPAAVENPATTFTPAVSARKSIASPDHILSLIDGKPYQTLKRHLARHGLTPDSYRERFNLPSSYPMVAPSFAAKRRAIAEKIGLGRKKKDEVPSEESKPLTAGDVPMSGADEIASEALAKAVTAFVPASNASKRGRAAKPPKADAAEVEGAAAKRPVESEGVVPADAEQDQARPEEASSSETAAKRPSESAPAKAPKAARAKKVQGSTAESTPLPAETPNAAAEEVAPAEVKPDRKARVRRGKLGLFGNVATEATSVPSPSETADAGVSGEAAAPASIKQSKPKSRRMARAAKSS